VESKRDEKAALMVGQESILSISDIKDIGLRSDDSMRRPRSRARAKELNEIG
jgi:hypothetical protein